MTVFLDVGAHNGQTLEQVVDYGFSHIYSFEPMPAQYETLQQRFGGLAHVTLLNYGLSNATGARTMYGTNKGYEASVYEAPRIDTSVRTEARFVRATDWLEEHLQAERAPIIAKLNCEGSEADILEDLMDSGAIWRLGNVAIAFDIRRFPTGEPRYRRLRRRLDDIGFDVNLRWQMFGWNLQPGCEDTDYHQAVCVDWLDRLPRWELP